MSLQKPLFWLLPKKRIQIGKTSEELEGIPAEYFEAKDCVHIVADRTADCEYPVLVREIPPTQMNCPTCHETTLAGLSYCDKCGAGLIKSE
ncbi:MAG: hypothetical protein PUC30_06680 [Lachnospiraceae bacterium]|nr:hypothetical protein [Lachnospiraceae bacterium]